jgi:hypothetical protein
MEFTNAQEVNVTVYRYDGYLEQGSYEDLLRLNSESVDHLQTGNTVLVALSRCLLTSTRVRNRLPKTISPLSSDTEAQVRAI